MELDRGVPGLLVSSVDVITVVEVVVRLLPKIRSEMVLVSWRRKLPY